MLRLGVDLKLFDAVVKLSNDSTNGDVSVQQLTDETGAEQSLLGTQLSASDKAENDLLTCSIARILIFLAAMGFVREISKDSFTSTASTAAFVSSSPLAAIVIHGYVLLQARKNGFRN